MKKVIVTQKPDADEVPAEIIAQSIETLARGMRALNSSRLSQRVVILLLADTTLLPMSTIKKVLDALDVLESKYLKSKPKGAK